MCADANWKDRVTFPNLLDMGGNGPIMISRSILKRMMLLHNNNSHFLMLKQYDAKD